MKEDLKFIKDCGFQGVVFGLLNASGDIDVKNMESLMSLCEGMQVTFHRAFDMCRDPLINIQALKKLGVSRVLTSGQKPSAPEGLHLLESLLHINEKPVIIAGAGIRSANIDTLIDIGITEFHSSASRKTPSPMHYRNPLISMSDSHSDEYDNYTVEEKEIERMKLLISSTSAISP